MKLETFVFEKEVYVKYSVYEKTAKENGLLLLEIDKLKKQLELCKTQRNKALSAFNYHAVKATDEEIRQFIREDDEELENIK